MDKVRAMAINSRDVVVTGMGAVTPFGVDVAALWDGARAGRNCVDWLESLTDLDPAIYPVRYAAEVKRFNVDEHLHQHCDVRSERSVQMGLVAARDALRQAQLLDASEKLLDSSMRIETIVGSGHGPCHEAEAGYSAFFNRGPQTIRPTTIPKSMFNSLASSLSIHFGLTGTNLVVASACASGAAAIGLASVLIRHGYANVVLAGGADSPFTPVTFASWTKLKVLAQNSEPSKASRPFDRQRNGLVLGEGAGMIVMETRGHAQNRGVLPLARIRGYGTASDAAHITSPTVVGQRNAMEACLADAGLEPESVHYINAHGTGTKANDETEARAIVEVFGRGKQALIVSSSKSMLGHSLGACGAIELILCTQALRHGFIPPTINCEEPDPDVGIDFVQSSGRPSSIQFALTNSFAFGGNNVAILLEKER